jgi:hypothetical protein
MTRQQILLLLAKNAGRAATMAIYPPFLFRFVRAKAKLIPERIDWLVWGFGEKPSRVFLWMAIVIGPRSAKKAPENRSLFRSGAEERI